MQVTDPSTIRAFAQHITPVESYPGEANGHKYRTGQILRLTGLEYFAEFNGDEVEVSSIRQDGPHGRAYYVKGRINQFLNWVYEYRLEEIPVTETK